MYMTESSFSIKEVEMNFQKKGFSFLLIFEFILVFISSLSCPVLCTLGEYVHWIFGYSILWADPDNIPSIFQCFSKFVFQAFQPILVLL